MQKAWTVILLMASGREAVLGAGCGVRGAETEGMSSLKPHRSSTRQMRRRAGCGRGYAQRSRARNRERGT